MDYTRKDFHDYIISEHRFPTREPLKQCFATVYYIISARETHNMKARVEPLTENARKKVRTGAFASVMDELNCCFPDLPPILVERFSEVLEMGQGVAQFLHSLDKPYGRNLIVEINGNYGLSCARLLPGRSTSLHYHSTRTEFFVVRCGELSVTDGDVEHRLHAGSVSRSTPGRPHRLSNAGHSICEFVEIFSPPLLDDKIRISDFYSRKVGEVTMLE